MKRIVLTVWLFFWLGFMVFWFLNIRMGLRPSDIRIVGAQRALDRMASTCHPQDRVALIRCLRRFVDPLTSRWGTRALMQALERRQLQIATDDISRTRCHDIAHLIGESGTKMKTVTETLLACTNLCEAGCYHGTVMGLMKQGNAIASVLKDACTGTELHADTQYSCFHGVGHVLGESGSFSFDQKLAECDKYSEKWRFPCGAGVFMEVYENPKTGSTMRENLGEDRPAWCNAFHAPYDKICYSFAGVYEYEQTRSFDQAVLICKRAPTEFIRTCIKDLGKSQYFSYPYDLDMLTLAHVFCQKYAPDWSALCFTDILYVSPK